MRERVREHREVANELIGLGTFLMKTVVEHKLIFGTDQAGVRSAQLVGFRVEEGCIGIGFGIAVASSEHTLLVSKSLSALDLLVC